jgi:glycerophosphoryl diester phosphodiesterase
MRAALFAATLALAACDFQDSMVVGSAAHDAATAGTMAPSNLPAFFDCLRDNSRTIVAAHRGGPAPGFAENAIETFEHTVSQTPAMLEIDIARTRDGALVLMHDDDLDRTTTGTGPVREHTLAEIQALRLRDNEGQALDARVPTFRQALDWSLGKAILEIDVKRGASYEDVIAEVRAADAMSRVVFITYSDDAAVRVHRLAPEMMLSISVDAASDLAALERRGIDLTRMLAWTGTGEPNAALNVALNQRGVEAIFGTLGNPQYSWDGRFEREGREQYAAFADAGLEIIATDRPVEASRDLDANDGADGLASLRCAAAR